MKTEGDRVVTLFGTKEERHQIREKKTIKETLQMVLEDTGQRIILISTGIDESSPNYPEYISNIESPPYKSQLRTQISKDESSPRSVMLRRDDTESDSILNGELFTYAGEYVIKFNYSKLTGTLPYRGKSIHLISSDMMLSTTAGRVQEAFSLLYLTYTNQGEPQTNEQIWRKITSLFPQQPPPKRGHSAPIQKAA
jgi:hypothetical protein